MKLYVDGPDDRGEGIYHLVAETGEHLASHYCSHAGFARFDVHDRRADLIKEWRLRFGEYQVIIIGEDDMTPEELQHRNYAYEQAAATSSGEGEG
jgi:hypothetical protein